MRNFSPKPTANAALCGSKRHRALREVVSLSILIVAMASARCAERVDETIETPNAILTVKAGSGDLIGLQWKQPSLNLIHEQRLGENFRIRLPLPDYDANYFNSRDQAVRKIDKTADGVMFHYGPLKNERETVNVDVTYEIRDSGSQLQFSIQVDNGTDRKLAEVLYGIVGGQHGIRERLDTESMIPGDPTWAQSVNLAPRMFSQYGRGWEMMLPFNSSGDSYPGTMSMGWMDVYNRKAGIGYYYANQDSETRISLLYTEMQPFAKRDSVPDDWPSPAEVTTNEPIGLTMGWVNFPYAGKGVFRAGPIALQVHAGDWHNAAKLYRGWFDQHFKIDPQRSWLKKEMAWYTVAMLDPNDRVLYRFKDLAKLAAEAKKYDVTTLQVFGWFTGGQDRGRPDHNPDPRLGTREEFRKALADIRGMGVHTLLGGNLGEADTSTKAFKTRYSHYEVQNLWGKDRRLYGFGPGTIGSRHMRTLGRFMTEVSPSHPQFRKEMINQYLNLIRDGAEGVEWDKAAEIGDLDFNPTVPTSPDKSLPIGVQLTAEEFLRRARSINPDVALCVAGVSDRQFPFNDVSYSDFHGPEADMVTRYTFPEWNFLSEVVDSGIPSGFDRLNIGLRYGLVWGMAPRLATASMDEPLAQPISRYLSELIRIRKRYADLLFFGRYNETEGAQVLGDKENLRYSVFAPADSTSSRRAVVIVNLGDRVEGLDVNVPDKQGQTVTISAPFEADRTAIMPLKLTLPPHRAAVIVAD